jgi:hypothetical protein
MNEPAVKQEASEEYNVSLIMPDQLMLIWKDVEKYLRKSCKRSKGRTSTQDIFYECLNNQSSLWIIFDTGNMKVVGCAITQITNYPTGKRMLNLDHVTGSKMGDWIDRGLEVMEKWAKDNNCNGIEGVGREGFWNWIKNRNWKKTAIFVEYNFEESV